ncbi:MAG: hypothetical protein ABW321_02880 [Polyangiales bacterium]
MKLSVWLAGCVLLLLGCVPERDDDESRVSAPRVIAIQMEPAEVGPRQRFTLRALYAGGDDADLDWSFCTEQKPLSELGPIAPSCLAPDGTGLGDPFGNGLEAAAAMPADACRLYGPDRPPAKPGEPSGRPVDADPSGGFYQPISLFDYDQGEASLFEARVACSLPGVTRQQFTEWTQRYVRNVNPSVDAIDVWRGDEVTPLDQNAAPLHVAAGEALELHVWTPACGTEVDDAAACGGAEPYLYFDLASRSLVTRTEALSASWFASSGRYTEARSRLTAGDDGSLGVNTWTAPDEPGPVTLWVVIRDDRGGVAWQRHVLEVE